ncbi:unnamed protein product [Didymodactylos carnosus]|uniref:Uncharacterized protein n=1 Tax=Didymodactylos carnosus TaxID=1234261 RepID=A0A813USS8_9BILA|nr:unnamed protein product [Didymodactylos carnosus]CAF3618956.1 unnamed protein product [Didymodactylos carnosus]
MISTSVAIVLEDCTINGQSNNSINTYNSNESTSLSCNAIVNSYCSNSDLADVCEADHEQENNKNDFNLNSKNKSFKRSHNKSNSTSTKNVLSDKTNETGSTHSSSVWQYAIRINNSNYATCCLCTDGKRISTNNGSTSTLLFRVTCDGAPNMVRAIDDLDLNLKRVCEKQEGEESTMVEEKDINNEVNIEEEMTNIDESQNNNEMDINNDSELAYSESTIVDQ